MNEELKHREWEQKMYAKYPIIFQQHKLDMSQTCMCWGICVDKGWYDIIETLCDNLQKIQKETGIITIATQVKSKFAGLCFYYDTIIPENMDKDITKRVDDEINKLVLQAERLSETLCETCGVEAKSKRIYGWVRVICPECEEKYYSNSKNSV